MVIKHNEYENTDNTLGLGNLLLGSVIILVWDFPDRLIIIFLLHQICPSLFCFFFWLFSDAFAPSLVDLMYVMILDGRGDEWLSLLLIRSLLLLLTMLLMTINRR
jgi:hypothetical protein